VGHSVMHSTTMLTARSLPLIGYSVTAIAIM